MSKVKLTLVKDVDGNTKLAIDYSSDDDLPSEHLENHINLVKSLVGNNNVISQDSSDDDDKVKIEHNENHQLAQHNLI